MRKHIIFRNLANKDKIELNSLINIYILNNRDSLIIICSQHYWMTHSRVKYHIFWFNLAHLKVCLIYIIDILWFYLIFMLQMLKFREKSFNNSWIKGWELLILHSMSSVHFKLWMSRYQMLNIVLFKFFMILFAEKQFNDYLMNLRITRASMLSLKVSKILNKHLFFLFWQALGCTVSFCNRETACASIDNGWLRNIVVAHCLANWAK